MYLKTPQKQPDFGDELVTSFFISLFEKWGGKVNALWKECPDREGGTPPALRYAERGCALLWRRESKRRIRRTTGRHKQIGWMFADA
jgi:hypothetical protein